MKRILAAGAATVALLGASASASPGGGMVSDQRRYVPREVVTLTVANVARPSGITLDEVWRIVDLSDGSEESQFYIPEEQRTLGDGESLVWQWGQNQGCYGTCQNVWEGEQVGPGRYEARLQTSDGMWSVTFSIGQYFHLGFEARPHLDFVVYVNDAADVEQLEAQAALPPSEQPIVSGIVRKRRSYNPEWDFSMGPASIETGDMFIEVCDGSPGYVNRHRKDWFGTRWCPWDGYVSKVGL